LKESDERARKGGVRGPKQGRFPAGGGEKCFTSNGRGSKKFEQAANWKKRAGRQKRSKKKTEEGRKGDEALEMNLPSGGNAD